jgi:signal transduction histidine kinase
LERKQCFVRHASHELRTPLSAITMGLKLLEEEILPFASQQTLNKALASHCDSVHSSPALMMELTRDLNVSCEVAIDTLNDLLLYEKIDGDLLKLEFQKLLVWDLVVEVAKMFRGAALNANVKLSWPDVCVPRCVIEADRHKLSQVVRNLISNALKFTPAGGEVTISAELMKSSDEAVAGDDARSRFFAVSSKSKASSTDMMVRISVTDSGAGLTKESQNRLFHEVVQFDAEKLQQGKGSGLGLWSKFVDLFLSFLFSLYVLLL